MKTRWIISLLLMLVLLGSVLSGCKPKEPETIKIGNLVAMTGGSATWGQSENNALKLIIEKINADGGINGKQIELITYDSRADKLEAVNVAKRMVEQDKVVAIIGAAQSGVANAVREVVNSAGVPLIATTATNPTVTVMDDGSVVPYTFRACFIDPFQGTVAGQFALRELGAKTAATLYDIGDEYSQYLSRYFVDAFTAGGGTVVASEAFRTGELDFRAQLGKIKEENPDVIFIPTMQKEAALAAKQARDLGITAELMGGDGWGSPDIVELSGGAIEGGYFVNLAAMEDPLIQDFLTEYRAKYNADPVMPNPLMAYDAMMWLADALEHTGGEGGEKLA
ncbi:MAG TPA: ABC transporter substrate-binding protein, partial [Anaerolineaceae bacterium]|nr:ABC transporter substrate-binding protein [Anaerolineaceae bacterium]